MVAAPEQIKRDAECVFRASEMPETFEFVERLSPLNQRLFWVDLYEVLSKVSIQASADDLRGLIDFIESWSATADLDSAPEVLALIRREKHYRPIAI